MYFAAQIDDIDTRSALFEYLTFRGDKFFTKYLPVGTLAAYLSMNVIGFAFVNIVNMKNTRPNPFMDNHGSLKSFYGVLFVWTPVMWLWSSMFVLRAVNDTRSYCDYFGESGLPSVLDREGRPLIPLAYQKCEIYTKWEVFEHNYFVWTAAFFLGLQFTHADQGIMSRFVLDWKIMKTWPLSLWVVFISLCLGLVLLASYLCYIYFTFDLQLFYLTYGSLLLTYFYIRGRHALETHIHHYVLSLMVLSFLSYQNIILTVVHGVFSGIFIEGASHWGLDPIWTYEWNEDHEKEPSDTLMMAEGSILGFEG